MRGIFHFRAEIRIEVRKIYIQVQEVDLTIKKVSLTKKDNNKTVLGIGVSIDLILQKGRGNTQVLINGLKREKIGRLGSIQGLLIFKDISSAIESVEVMNTGLQRIWRIQEFSK